MEQAHAYYEGLRGVLDEFRLTDHPSRQILDWGSTRLVRLVRRRGIPPEMIEMYALLRVLDGGELGPVDSVLTELVRVQALTDAGLQDDVLTSAREVLAMWRAHHADVPWAAALYLDALSEHAPAWLWANQLHVVPNNDNGLRLTLIEHALEVTGAPDRPRDATLEDVTRHFRMQPIDRVRTPYPVAMGRALMQCGRKREALRFFDAAVRVADWVCDLQGLMVALEGRARTHEDLGAHDDAVNDWDRLLRLLTKPEWQAARDHAEQRAAAVRVERSTPFGAGKQTRKRRRG
jgi:tetratricopeptide (TPR) repeat protein